MGSYEELVRDTVDTLLQPDAPVSIDRLATLVSLRVYTMSKEDRIRPLDRLVLEAVLRADPRFVEVAPGMWVRRTDGPEAGVPSRPKRPPLAGSAAAEAVPPTPEVDLDVVGGTGGRAATAAS